MESTQITFDQLPAYVYQLGRKVDDLTALLRSQSEQNQPLPDRWFSIEELSKYLPGEPAITTIYGKVQRREIPHFKEGKRLVFLKSQIDAWLKSKRTKTSLEIEETAEHHTTRRSGRQKV